MDRCKCCKLSEVSEKFDTHGTLVDTEVFTAEIQIFDAQNRSVAQIRTQIRSNPSQFSIFHMVNILLVAQALAAMCSEVFSKVFS